MNDTMGRAASAAITESVILTEFDSTSQTYMRTCVIERTVPEMRANIPAVYDEERRVELKMRDIHSQCHLSQLNEGLPS